MHRLFVIELDNRLHQVDQTETQRQPPSPDTNCAHVTLACDHVEPL